MVIIKVKLTDVKLDRATVNNTIAEELKNMYIQRKVIPCAVVDAQMHVVRNFETAAVLKDLGVPEIYVEQINV